MTEFPGNSQSAKNQGPKIEQPIVTDGVRIVKPTLGAKFKQTFFSGVDSRNVISYVCLEIIVPYIKEMIVDSGTTALQRSIYGDSARGRAGRPGGYLPAGVTRNPTPYGSVYSQRPSRPTNAPWVPPEQQAQRAISQEARQFHRFNEISLSNRGQAELVSEKLFEYLAEYGVVTVADLYQLVGVSFTPEDYTYGWTNLQGTRILPHRGEYLIDLPKPVPVQR